VERHEWHCHSHWREGFGGEIGEIDVRRTYNCRGFEKEFGGISGLWGDRGEVGIDRLDGWCGVGEISRADMFNCNHETVGNIVSSKADGCGRVGTQTLKYDLVCYVSLIFFVILVPNFRTSWSSAWRGGGLPHAFIEEPRGAVFWDVKESFDIREMLNG
jgi:hypothetical protein